MNGPKRSMQLRFFWTALMLPFVVGCAVEGSVDTVEPDRMETPVAHSGSFWCKKDVPCGADWIESSFVDGIPCSPPCWQQISPGITESAAALEILKHSDFVRSVDQNGTLEFGGAVWYWTDSGARFPTGMYWENGTIVQMNLGIPGDLPLDIFIQHYGEPAAVIAGVIEYPHSPPYWILDLYYPDEGITLTAFTEDLDSNIFPTSNVGHLSLYVPTTLEMATNDLREHFGDDFTEDLLEEWQGYGDILEMYSILDQLD